MTNRVNFRTIWLSNAASELGGALFTACNSILVYELTGSTAALGSVWLIYYIASFFMQLFIGPYIDRWSRKRTMISCQLVRMVLATVLLLVLLLDSFSLVQIYVLQIIAGLVMPVFAPANQAILPTVLEKSELTKANASLDGTRQIMVIMGPLLSGIFVDYVHIEWVLLIIVIAFLSSAIHLMRVKENYQKATMRKAWIHEFREGLQSFLHHRLIVWLGMFFGFVQFGVGVTIVTNIPYITTVLDKPYTAFGIFMAGFPIGYTVGSLLNHRIGQVKGIRLLFTALFIGGCTYISLGMTPWFTLALMTEIIAGIAIAFFNIYHITLIQQEIPSQILGKVTSVRLLIMRTMMPLGILFATVTAPFIPIRILYLIIGGVICITSLCGYTLLSRKPSLQINKVNSR